MGIISTASHPKALWPGVKAFWGTAYNEHKTEYTQLFDAITSDQHYEEFVQDTPFALVPVKAEGAPVNYTDNIQGPTTRITAVTYALGYIVTREELEDDLYMSVSSRRAPALARAFRQTKERVAAGVYNNAFNSSYVGGDGICLLSTAHTNVYGGTYANKQSVDADLSESAIEDMLVTIMLAQDDRGNLINLNARSLHVHPNNWFIANRILKTPYQPDTSNNNINVIYATNAIPQGIHMNHYFTSTTNWFIRTDIPKPQGMVLIDRVGISFEQDNDFDTTNLKYMGRERYNVGWVDPRALYGSNAP